MNKNKLKVKAIISSLLLLIFIIVTITGVGLWLAADLTPAELKDWTFLGMHRKQLATMHTRFGFAMVGLIIIHLFSNWRMFMTELKVLFGRK